jgi:hypothetical protein
MDTFTVVEDNLEYFGALHQLGIPNPFQPTQYNRVQPTMFELRVQRLNEIDLYEYEKEKLDRNIQKRTARISNLILSMVQGTDSRYINRW